MKNPKTANETQHKHAIQNNVMYAQCSALSAPGPMGAMKYALSQGGAEDQADFCVRIIQQKVTSHPVEN